MGKVVIWFLCLMMTLNLVFESGESCTLRRITVHMINFDLPEGLFVHCFSKDDDLGKHTVGVEQEYTFSFCVNPFKTKFRCHLQWRRDHSKWFDGYKGEWDPLGIPCGSHCYWQAQKDGIFLNGRKRYDWDIV